MRSIRELIGQEIKWTQPRTMKQEFELRCGEEIEATLRFRSSFGSLATGECADGCWTFKRVGFWRTRATVRVCGSEADIAVFSNNTWTSGGTLELPDGRVFPANSNFWMTQYEFKTEGGEPLIRYRRIGGILHLSSLVEIRPAAASMAELPWMVILGWYLTVMMQQDSGAAAAVVVAAT
jgi:hypothetical protein